MQAADAEVGMSLTVILSDLWKQPILQGLTTFPDPNEIHYESFLDGMFLYNDTSLKLAQAELGPPIDFSWTHCSERLTKDAAVEGNPEEEEELEAKKKIDRLREKAKNVDRATPALLKKVTKVINHKRMRIGKKRITIYEVKLEGVEEPRMISDVAKVMFRDGHRLPNVDKARKRYHKTLKYGRI